MAVYSFRQNNSGGVFLEPAQSIIVVAAKSEDHALEIAKKAGLYLNGVSRGIDCECCGDRWSNYASEFDSVEDAKAYAEKSCYGQPYDDGVAYLVTDDLDWDWDLEDDTLEESWRDCNEYDGQPDEYTEWQDVYGGDDWDQGQYDNDIDF